MNEQQPNNPLHGVKLKDILEFLVEELGWNEMAEEIPIRCFEYDPSIKSSLVFLRRTAWARNKVEALYIKLKKGDSDSSDKKSHTGQSHGKYSVRKR